MTFFRSCSLPLLAVGFLSVSLSTGCKPKAKPAEEAPPGVELCEGATAKPPEDLQSACSVTAGEGMTLYTGTVLTPGKVYEGGQVLVDGRGVIACVGCGCLGVDGAAAATRVDCVGAVISPGLINPHDHMREKVSPQPVSGDERYEHRHDWRVGRDGHKEISSKGSTTEAELQWKELRHLMAGTTSLVGAGGSRGLLRNLDSRSVNTAADGTPLASQEGLDEGLYGVDADTFPLGDSNGRELVEGCGYQSRPSASIVPFDAAYLPHVAEGVEKSAQNELSCVADALGPRTSIVHGIAVTAKEVELLASKRTSLIWSPRSNVSLYGDTAPVTLYARQGIPVALGTDWLLSGSMNMLRELKCAAGLNSVQFGGSFSDEELWRMATAYGADVTRTQEKLGRLDVGKMADLAVFRRKGEATYRSVVDANPEDVMLVARGGKVLYGDEGVLQGLSAAGCETIDVCGAPKSVCVTDELGQGYSALAGANAASYPLFFCEVPANEPTCVPQRAAAWSKLGSTSYSGEAPDADRDGDGVANEVDNCSAIFNPVRVMDNGAQADSDGDGLGDACDPCPLQVGADGCGLRNPNDVDGDGVDNGTDNCVADANPGQEDGDYDGKGDACDVCSAPNPGNEACVATIYEVKKAGSPLLGTRVTLGQVLVTATGPTGFFVQVHPSEPHYTGPDDSALFVYTGKAPTVKPGDRLDINNALAGKFFGQVQVSDGKLGGFSNGHPLPTPVAVTAAEVATGGARAAGLEGVLVSIGAVSVIDIAPMPGTADSKPTNEFTVTGGLRIDDYFYKLNPFASLDERFDGITGVLRFANDHSKLEPRNAADLKFGPPVVTEIGPSPTFTREGVSGNTFPGTPLTVTISRAQTAAVVVNVASNSASLTLPASTVTVPANARTVVVPVNGVTQAQAVTVTASLNGSSKDATVRVLGAAEPAKLVAVVPATANARAGQTVKVTVRLDIPAPSDQTVNLAVNPATGFGSVPATVTVPTNALEATFELVTEPGVSVTGTVMATLGADSAQANVTLTPKTAGLVINEIDYDAPSGAADSREFVEIFNSGSTVVDLSNLELVFINGNPSVKASYMRVKLAPAGSLAPGQYLVVKGAAVVLAAQGALTLPLPAAIQNGGSGLATNDPDAVGIFDTSTKMLLDAVSYEGRVTGVSFEGVTLDFYEGPSTGTPVGENSNPGALARLPNGTDNDNNLIDFKRVTDGAKVTPGSANLE